MTGAAHLVAATDRTGHFSGYCKCSLCGAEFRPNPKRIREITETFAAHIRYSHPAYETVAEVNDMAPDISPSQKRRREKIARLQKYFHEYRPRTYEWTPTDDGLDFASMSDEDVARYLDTPTAP